MAKKKTSFVFPVGYREFHKDQVFNFQLNRWHSLGYARFVDMVEAGKKISTFSEWKNTMIRLAEKALAEERFMNAAFYFRAAEFYTFQDDPDKEKLYDRYIDLFYRTFEDDGIERYRVPYDDTFLPAMRVRAAAKKSGCIVMHGGFDSFIEEFYSWMRFFSDHGYDVIAFEGPGQGRARRKCGLTLDYRWERPTQAVLDHFRLEDVTWLGISMGGWFCFRAAAFEPRIQQVAQFGQSEGGGAVGPNCRAHDLTGIPMYFPWAALPFNGAIMSIYMIAETIKHIYGKVEETEEVIA